MEGNADGEELQAGSCRAGIQYHPSGERQRGGSGVLRIQGGSGLPRGGGGLITALPLFVCSPRYGSVAALLSAALARSSWLLGLDQPVLLHICLDQTKVKPKESIRSAVETPITCLGRLPPSRRAALGPASPRRRGLSLRAGTEGFLCLPAAPPPRCACPPPSAPFSKREKKKKSLLIRIERFFLLRMVPLPSPAGVRLKIITNYE